MIGSIFAFMVVALGQDVKKDYRMPVMPISKFGQWLGKETGREVIVLPQVQDRLVYINVKNRTLPEVLGFLKDAVGVGVLDRNEVLTLTDVESPVAVPMLDKEQIQIQLDKAVNAKADREQLKVNLKELASIEENLLRQQQNSEYSRLSAQRMNIIQSDPVTFAGVRLAEILGVDGLANLPQWERVVFSTNPTRMQRSWPGGVGRQILRETNQELKLKNELLVELGIQPNLTVNQWPISRLLHQDSGEITLLRVVARRTGYSIALKTEAFSDTGDLISSGELMLQGWSIRSKQASVNEAALTELTKDFEGEKISLDPEDIKLFERFYRMQGYSNYGTPDVEDLRWLSEVDVSEPLAGKPTELFDLVLDRLGREAVLQMSPDFRLKVGKSDVSLREVAHALLGRKHARFISDPNAVLIRSSVGDDENQWVPRRVEAEYARRYTENGKLTLGDLSDLFRQIPNREVGGQFLFRVLKVTGQEAENTSIDGFGLQGLLLAGFSSLNARSQDAIFSENGHSGSMSQMPLAIQNLYSSVVTCSSLNSSGKIGRYFDENGKEQPIFPPDWPDNVGKLASNLEQTVFLEWPVFNPPSLKIHAENANKLMVRSSLKGQSLGTKSYTIEALAMQIAAVKMRNSEELRTSSSSKNLLKPV